MLRVSQARCQSYLQSLNGGSEAGWPASEVAHSFAWQVLTFVFLYNFSFLISWTTPVGCLGALMIWPLDSSRVRGLTQHKADALMPLRLGNRYPFSFLHCYWSDVSALRNIGGSAGKNHLGCVREASCHRSME